MVQVLKVMKLHTTQFVGWLGLGAGLTLAGGSMVGPDYKAPATTMPAAYGELPATRPDAATKFAGDTDREVRWWRRLNDAKLTDKDGVP